MREAQIDDECAQVRPEGRAWLQPLRRRRLEPFRTAWAGPAKQRHARDIGLDLRDLDVIVGLAGDLRRAGDVSAAMLASGRHHIAPGCGIWMQRPMRASVRLAFWLARRIIRRLAPLRGRRARIVRRLRWQAKFRFEFGDACPKHGVFRNQSVDPRYQRDNQRVFLRRIK